MSGTSIKTAMLLVVFSLALVGLSVQASITKQNVQELIDGSSSLTNAIVFVTDRKYYASRNFLAKDLETLSEKLGKEYPTFQQYQIDRRDPGQLKKDPLYDYFKITEYPSALLFVNGVPILYENTMTAEDIKARLVKGLGNNPVEISTIGNAKKLDISKLTFYYKSTDVAVLNRFKGLAAKYPKYKFVNLQFAGLAKDVAKLYSLDLENSEGTVVFMRRPGDLIAWQLKPTEDLSLKALVKFINKAAKATVSFFDRDSIKELSSFKRGVILANVDPNIHTSLMGKISMVIDKDYNKAVAYFIEPTNSEGLEFLSSIGMPTNFPQVTLIKRRTDGKFDKFLLKKLSDNTSVSNLREFVEDCMDNFHPKIYQSEQEPNTDLYHNIHTLVGRTIDHRVFKEKGRYHIVFLYNKATIGALPKFQQLAQKFVNEKVAFYIFDTDKNESKHLNGKHSGKVLVFKFSPRVKRVFTVDKTLSLSKMGVFLEQSLKHDKELVEKVRQADYWQDL